MARSLGSGNCSQSARARRCCAMAWGTSPCSSNRSARELSTLALLAGSFWKTWRHSSSSAFASPKRPKLPSATARFIRVRAMSSAGRCNARLTSRHGISAAQGRLPVVQGTVGIIGDVERADERAGEELGIRGLRHGLAGAMPLPPVLHLRQSRFHLRQRLRGPALHDVDAQGFQFAADDIDGGTARLSSRPRHSRDAAGARRRGRRSSRRAIAQLPVIQARSAHAWRASSPPALAAVRAWLAACS